MNNLPHPPEPDDEADLIEPLDDKARFPHGKPAHQTEDETGVVLGLDGGPLEVPPSEQEMAAARKSGVPVEVDGPLVLPRISDPRLKIRLGELAPHEWLAGWATAASWLPEDDRFPELAALRDQHVRVRGEVAASVAALSALGARFAGEDERRRLAELDAIRHGGEVDVDVTPEADRVGERRAIETRLLAALEVLVAIVADVRDALDAHEYEWLASLRRDYLSMENKRAEAQRLLDEAAEVEHAAIRRAMWLKTERDGQGHQPFPADAPAPAGFDPSLLAERAFERSYHEHDRLNSRPGVPFTIRRS